MRLGSHNIGTVLVVDDSDIVLQVVRTTLEEAGYRVITRNQPVGTVAVMLQEEPDLVLVDVAMPEVGGDTLVRCFGTAHPNSTTTVLLHSSLPVEVLQQKVAASGAHGYIRKTSNQTAFVREIADWMRRSPRAHGGGFREPTLKGSGQWERSTSEQSEGAWRSGVRLGAPSVVLLVDTDMLRLSNYRKQLQCEELAFEFALSGAHAWGRITGEAPPDLVVSNTKAGDVSGMEVYRRAVALDQRWVGRFIFFTADGDDPETITFGSTFRGDMLFEPVDPAQLKQAIVARLAPRSGRLAAG